MRFWEVYSTYYDGLNKLIPYRKMIGDIVSELEVENNQLVLDAGCGTGNVCLQLADKASVLGIDSCIPMLDRAKEKLKSYGNATLQYSDLSQDLAFEDNHFDAAVLSNVLYALEQPEQVLQELHRVLKPDAKLVIVNPVSSPKNMEIFYEHRRLSKRAFHDYKILSELSLVRLINGIIVKKGAKGKYNFFEHAKILDLLKSVGFKCTTVKKTYADQAYLIKCTK